MGSVTSATTACLWSQDSHHHPAKAASPCLEGEAQAAVRSQLSPGPEQLLVSTEPDLTSWPGPGDHRQPRAIICEASSPLQRSQSLSQHPAARSKAPVLLFQHLRPRLWFKFLICKSQRNTGLRRERLQSPPAGSASGRCLPYRLLFLQALHRNAPLARHSAL